jgi:hypothetical protein
MFLGGLFLALGITKMFGFFFQVKKWKGTCAFFLGFVLVIVGWAFIGVVIELFGFLNLFGDFFPTLIAFMKHMPIIGSCLQLPGISSIVDLFDNTNTLPV